LPPYQLHLPSSRTFVFWLFLEFRYLADAQSSDMMHIAHQINLALNLLHLSEYALYRNTMIYYNNYNNYNRNL
jgi:hypothetical protein